MMHKKIMAMFLVFVFLPLASAAHYIVGYVENAKDGTLANGYSVVLWNPINGQSDNLTDVVGPSGNSGNDNLYLIDCELLGTPCNIGDTLNLQIFDDGDGYVSDMQSVVVSGAGYDLVNNLSLNSPPEFESIVVDDSISVPMDEIDLTPATTKKVNCTAIINEYDGEESFANASAEFYNLADSFYGDINDNNYHYSNSSCTTNLDYGTSNEVEVICSFDVWYYANSGDWNCSMMATDNYTKTNSGNDTNSINALLAIGVNSPVSYGDLSAQEVSPELEINVTNYGNVQINLSLSGYAISEGDGYSMNCSSGISPNISIGYEKYNLENSISGNLTLSQFEGNYTNLTSSPKVGKFNLFSRENELVNDAINSTYWRIYVPQDISGGCQGNIVFGAVQAEESP